MAANKPADIEHPKENTDPKETNCDTKNTSYLPPKLSDTWGGEASEWDRTDLMEWNVPPLDTATDSSWSWALESGDKTPQ
jgi:hypothetical protein